MNVATRTALVAALALPMLAACSRPEELPDMGVSRTSLSFEAPGGSGDPTAQTVYVVNTGRGSLARPSAQIAYVEGSGWLAATVSGGGAPYAVAVQPSVSVLAPGTYHAAITLACGNASSSPVQVDVTLTVPDPRFTLSVASLAFDAPRGGGDPPPQTFQVLNAGRGTLPVPDVAISYVGASGWLSASVGGTPDAYTVEVTARAAGLDSGTYAATIAISASAAEGPPRTLAVVLTVPPAEIALSVPTVWFGGTTLDGIDPAPISVAIANAGGGFMDPPSATVSYPADDSGTPWLSASVSGAQAPYAVTLTARQWRADSSSGQFRMVSLPSGSHAATVVVTAPDAAEPKAIGVTLLVPQPEMGVVDDNGYGRGWFPLEFRNFAGCPLPPAQTIRIINVGAGILERPTVSVTDASGASDPPWLSVNVAGDADPYLVTVAVVARPGSSGAATLAFTAPGAPIETLGVSYAEDEPAWTMSLAPEWITIRVPEGTDPPRQRVLVSTPGTCSPSISVAVSYGDGADPAWLEATSTPLGPDRHELTVTPSSAWMSAGSTHIASVALGFPEHPSVLVASVPITILADAFAPTAPLTVPRHDFTLTSWPGVGVVAAGGDGAATASTAEVWSGSSWTATDAMTQPRSGHGAATTLSGDVLVCGGTLPSGEPVATCETIETWWTSDYVWIGRPSLAYARHHPILLPLPLPGFDDERFLVVSPGAPAAEIYDLAGRYSWTVAGVDGAGAVPLSDDEFLVAGESGRAWTFLAWSGWTETGPMRPMVWPVLARLPDGGALAISGSSTDAQRWDPVTREWHDVPGPLAPHLPSEVATIPTGKVLAVGGPGGTFELFDPETETWSVAAVTFPTERHGAAVYASGTAIDVSPILIAGGETTADPIAGLTEAFTW